MVTKILEEEIWVPEASSFALDDSMVTA